MDKKSITSTKEDYLRAIFHLQEENLGKVGTVKIAGYLRLSKSTVSERLQELAKEGLIIKSNYSSVVFTKKGYAIAREMTFKHRVIEVFLNRILKLSKKEVHQEAHKLEHAFSRKVIKRLSRFLGNPKRDPHGVIIPKIK